MNCKCGNNMMKLGIYNMWWCNICGTLCDGAELIDPGEYWYVPSNNPIEEKSENLQILIKYHDKDLLPIEINDKGNWIDLRSAETIELKKDEYRLISLGVSIQLPDGYEAYIVPRSSTFKNFGIIQTNHHGIVDESFCGDADVWMFPAYAMRDTVINKNDRICQFRIQKIQSKINFKEVLFLENKNRNGIGSSGRN